MRDEIFEIEIVNWDKHQPKRKDVKHSSWFKVSNYLFEDAVIAQLIPSEFMVWMFLLTVASKMNHSCVRVSTQLIRSRCRVRTHLIHSTISVLEQYQMVKVVSRNVHEPLDKIRREEIRREEKRGEETTEPKKQAQLDLVAKHQNEIKKPSNRPSKARPHGAIVEFQNCSECVSLLSDTTHEIQKAWLNTYPGIEWVEQEIKRADVWIKSNPNKKPKVFGRFMSAWLSRSFESYRKGLPSRRLTQSEINAEALKEMSRKNMAGEYD